jgi:hypothetical protein
LFSVEGETKVYTGYDHTPDSEDNLPLDSGAPQTFYRIITKHKHPQYNATKYKRRNDIVLVQLDRPVNGKAATICLPEKGIKPVMGRDEYLMMSGWSAPIAASMAEYRPLQVTYRVLVSLPLLTSETEFYHSSPGSSKVCPVSYNIMFSFIFFILVTLPARRWLPLMAVLLGKGCSHWHTLSRTGEKLY